MEERSFGETGLHLPALSLGTAAIGRPAYLNVDHGRDIEDPSLEGMRRLAFDILNEAYNLGLRHIDTAHSYGLAEQFIAEWLAQYDVDDVFLTSKWGYNYVGDWRVNTHPQEIKDLSLETFARQAPLSFRRFGHRLKGFQIHSATIESGVLMNASILAALNELAEDGVLIGVSTTGPNQSATIDLVAELRTSGTAPFSFVQSTWNLFETSATGALTRAREAGLGVIVKEALSNGRLVRGQVPPAVERAAIRHDVGADAVCLAAALALACRPVVLAGPSRVEQLRLNAKAANITLAEDELAELETLAIDPSCYWTTRAALSWT